MTMHKALHPRDDNERLYVSRREGGRRPVSTEDSMDTSIHRLEDYIQKRERILIIKNNNNERTSGSTITRKQKWEEKKNSIDVSND